MPQRRTIPALLALASALLLAQAATADLIAPPADDGAAAPSAEPAPQPVEEAVAHDRGLIVFTISRGDTLAALLKEAGLGAADTAAALAALRPHLAPRALRPGQEVRIETDPIDPSRLFSLTVDLDPLRRLRLDRNEDGTFSGGIVALPAIRHLVRADGEIRSSLYADLRAAGLSSAAILSLIRALSHSVDLQRDLRPGDRFTVLHERFRAPDGTLLQEGGALFLDLALADRRIRIWRYTRADGTTDWYDDRGQSLRRTLLRTPLDGARISSGFGLRTHPILGFDRHHRGVDFAAPAGTPVFAAGDGTVTFAGWRGDYGRTVMIRHAGGYDTLYAHLSTITVRPGAAVRQGQVIGRVGATGLATGPHLHFEVHRNQVAIDPRSIRSLPNQRLEGVELARFNAHRARTEAKLAALAERLELAVAD
ncbi:MAG: M23 family metallopeptidase [Elioraea sp.]|nr:M23 family metallopeptidase [Elioraea sp.]